MSETVKIPSVENFEQAVAAKNYEAACVELLDILGRLDENFGGIQNIGFNFPSQLAEPTLEQERVVYFCSRMATAITELFSDPRFEVSDSGALRFLTLQRWISMIFASSPFINADHVLKTYDRSAAPSNSLDIHIDASRAALIKFCISVRASFPASFNKTPFFPIIIRFCDSRSTYTVQRIYTFPFSLSENSSVKTPIA